MYLGCYRLIAKANMYAIIALAFILAGNVIALKNIFTLQFSEENTTLLIAVLVIDSILYGVYLAVRYNIDKNKKRFGL